MNTEDCASVAATDFGFTWGPMTVERCAHYSPRAGRETFALSVSTPYGSVDVCVSGTGRSIRVFQAGQELTR